MPSSQSDSIRLCVQTHHPIDPGNYDGPIHCTAHPEGHPCVTAMYARVPDSTFTEKERRTCGRLLVGQGTDTWDPLCRLPIGHKEECKP